MKHEECIISARNLNKQPSYQESIQLLETRKFHGNSYKLECYKNVTDTVQLAFWTKKGIKEIKKIQGKTVNRGQVTKCPKIYRKSVLHLLQYTAGVKLNVWIFFS